MNRFHDYSQLAFVTAPSRRWAVFVANRVSEIQRLTNVSDWRHISFTDNPADILSRGLEPRGLLNLAMWWHGPGLLTMTEDRWPTSNFKRLEILPETRGPIVTFITAELSIPKELICKFSNLDKVCRILAYCLRFRKARRPNKCIFLVSHSEKLYVLDLMCRIVQKQSFSSEYKALIKGETVDARSSLLPLAPFLSADNLIRVGGRLEKADLTYDASHPDISAAWTRVDKTHNRARTQA